MQEKNIKASNCIFFMLARASQSGARYWTKCLKDLKLTAVQAMVISFLGENDMVTSKELSGETGLDAATLTGVLDRLESSGYVERKPHPTDRRAMYISLTGQGLEIMSLIRKKAVPANMDFLSALSDSEKKEFRRLLRLVRQGPS